MTAEAPQNGLDAGRDLGYIPATAEQPLNQTMSAILITPPKARSTASGIHRQRRRGPGQPPPSSAGRSGARALEFVAAALPMAKGAGRGGTPHRYRKRLRTRGFRGDHPLDLRLPHHDSGVVRHRHNALVDKYGQVFEGRAGGITKDVMGSHTGGFNRDVWGVSMIGNFEDEPPPDVLVRAVGKLIGWRLSLDRVNPLGSVSLTSAGGSYTVYPAGATPTLPEIFAHRDVGNTECPEIGVCRTRRNPQDSSRFHLAPTRWRRSMAVRFWPGGSPTAAKPARWACRPHRKPPVKARLAMRHSSAGQCTGLRTPGPSR